MKATLSCAVAVLAALIVLPVLPAFNESHVQAVASAMATVAGILAGFVMASLTVLASASGNTLVKNTKMTGYLPKLVNRLHFTMGTLLLVCFLFLGTLFIPITATLPIPPSSPVTRVVDLVILAGVFVFALSVCCFARVWRRFTDLAAHM